MEIKLPTTKVGVKGVSPRRLVIYGPPKIGKTTSLSKLDNCLIIDLEKGTDYVEALKIQASSLTELSQIGKKIIESGKPYKYVAIDTITALENLCEVEAKEMYTNTPIGKNFKGDSVLELPNGAGYYWLRQSFNKWIERLYLLADHVILIGHLKEKFIEKKGKEIAAKDIDLTGKLKAITCANADAIGYIYREGNTTMISFGSGEEIATGSRCAHLQGYEGELDWSKIFID